MVTSSRIGGREIYHDLKKKTKNFKTGALSTWEILSTPQICTHLNIQSLVGNTFSFIFILLLGCSYNIVHVWAYIRKSSAHR